MAPGLYKRGKTEKKMNNRTFTINYHLMLLPGMILLGIFSFVPMFGVIIAFQQYYPARGIFRSKFIGLDNFIYMFQLPDSKQIFINTILIASMKIIANLIVPLLFALLLNEIRIIWFKRTFQTVVYLPYFLSWVILASAVINIFSVDGVVNKVISLFGVKPVFFMASNDWFRPIVVLTSTWKDFGFNMIVYLAAITGINTVLYEAATIDGATRMQQLRYVTIPGILPTIILLATLSLGNVLNAGFDQIFNLYNPLVYSSGDIIDTYVYRAGLVQAQYSFATAVGLLKSVISFILIVISYKLADRFANYRIF